MFIESGVNRAIKANGYKLIHLNDVQQYLGIKVYSQEQAQITDFWPAAGDVYQFYNLDTDPDEQNNIMDSNDEADVRNLNRMMLSYAPSLPA